MKHYFAAFMIAVPASLLSTSVMSAAGIVEAQPFLPGQAPVSGVQPGSSSSNDALVMLLDQFREMRSEMETLRGLVEEQGYELRNLQRQSFDRYSDLDSRIAALASGDQSTLSAPPSTPAPTAALTQPSSLSSASQQTTGSAINVSPTNIPTTSTPTQTAPTAPVALRADNVPVPPVGTVNSTLALATPSVGGGTMQPTVLSEQQQYQQALDSLLQEEQYQRSISEFDQYLSLYPAGRFVTNAYYWKGQAYVNLSLLNEARDAFETIVTQYPDGRKVDDAMYSLGSVYDKLGNQDRARQLLRQVQSRFPNTSAANLADIYLRSMN
jgi:tol-pal system protein YbgF